MSSVLANQNKNAVSMTILYNFIYKFNFLSKKKSSHNIYLRGTIFIRNFKIEFKHYLNSCLFILCYSNLLSFKNPSLLN